MNRFQVFLLAPLFCLLSNPIHSQVDYTSFKSTEFKGIELKTGIGLPFLKTYNIPLSLLYQQNISKHLSIMLLSELLYDQNYNDQFNFDQYTGLAGMGIGTTFGHEKINQGLYLLGSSRFHFSTLKIKDVDFEQAKLETNSITPELGFLYNVRCGRKKIYFSSQIYIALTPIKNFIESQRHTLMLGIGYRLNTLRNQR